MDSFDAQIVSLTNQGATIKEVAATTGRSYHSVWHRKTRIASGVAETERKWWPADLEQEVHRLWADGVSQAQIGILVGKSASAIAGKISRMKIRQIDRLVPAPKPRAPRKTKPWSERKKYYSNRSKPVIPPAPEPEARNIPFADLEKNDCRYVVTADHPMLFCGNPKAEGSSYCAHHHHVCWVTPAARVRVPRPR